MGNSQIRGGSKLISEEEVSNLSFLGEGDFSKVYKGTFLLPGTSKKQIVSIKVPKVPAELRKEKKIVKTHIEEVKKLLPGLKRARNDVYAVRVLGIGYDDFRKEVWVIREFVDGTDLETIVKNPSLCPSLRMAEKRLEIAIGIANGMAYLHNLSIPIVHGDFKLSDVLLPAGPHTSPKITNFGLWDFKQFFVDTALPTDLILLNPCQSPEVYIDGERPTLFSDSWSLAAVILHWMLELPPWDLQDLCDRYRCRNNKQHLALQYAMQNEEDPSILTILKEEKELEFLKDCLNYKSVERPPLRLIAQELTKTAQIPSWTNVAYHKYYN